MGLFNGGVDVPNHFDAGTEFEDWQNTF